MREILIQLVTACLGSLGFSILFGLRRRYLQQLRWQEVLRLHGQHPQQLPGIRLYLRQVLSKGSCGTSEAIPLRMACF